MNEPITSFTGEYFFLSNFFERPFRFHGTIFPTAEHGFHACKGVYIKSAYDELKAGEGQAYWDDCAAAPSPAKAKYLGRSIEIDVAQWEENKAMWMQRVLHAKFDQHKDLQKKLLETTPRMLVEGNTWGDTEWGRFNGKGKNLLGSILMEIRGLYVWSTFD